MGLAVVIFCYFLVLQFPSFTSLSNNTSASGYGHGNEKNISNAYQAQSISNMKELLKGDLVPITNYSQPLGPIYVLRGGGGGRGGDGGRGGGSHGGTRGSRGGSPYGFGYGGSSCPYGYVYHGGVCGWPCPYALHHIQVFVMKRKC
ncbi:hypothetical protein C5167_028794 [Papaver somniferum]|uniref:glycine-rich RNA-binding protein 10-like n=1 Tax=Papaver somniferum TaxID=3469 RepID=UPI000E704F2F|nr:glycine-rich RNA-binding protein 10-like [Papaver somniferum]RZC90961.1 hypothetical protein C5167_028794 [Papaver somniferum]